MYSFENRAAQPKTSCNKSFSFSFLLIRQKLRPDMRQPGTKRIITRGKPHLAKLSETRPPNGGRKEVKVTSSMSPACVNVSKLAFHPLVGEKQHEMKGEISKPEPHSFSQGPYRAYQEAS
jgi:hypothetical protein